METFATERAGLEETQKRLVSVYHPDGLMRRMRGDPEGKDGRGWFRARWAWARGWGANGPGSGRVRRARGVW